MILRLKRTPGLYMVGFMASGKTTLGRMLADHIGWGFADLDEDVEKQEQQSIAEIFEMRGEAEFRRLEREAIRKRVRAVECGRPLVMALGGGAFVEPETYSLLENNGVSIWLDCPLEQVEKRVAQGTAGNQARPLARDMERMRALYEGRRDAYAKADYRVEMCTEDPAENLRAVLALPIFR